MYNVIMTVRYFHFLNYLVLFSSLSTHINSLKSVFLQVLLQLNQKKHY